VQTTLVLIVVAAAGVALYLWKRKKLLGGNEDRPEIVVRNDRLSIETDKDWTSLSSNNKWKPDHEDGKSVKEFVVTVENSQDCSPGKTMTGESVTIVYMADSHRRKIRVTRKRNSKNTNEPLVDADLRLKHYSGDLKKLKHDTDSVDRIIEVAVRGNTPCTCPDRAGQPVVVRINMTYV
jgi:hypothetical protein